ncbi:MAG TPA: hypothetical protein PK950_00695 [Candidatus Paceibacterota bacterium]|nr:hypothetical protein [Candidatus Paceibacterota bacterium]
MKNLLSKSMKAAVLALVFGAVTVFAAPFQGPTSTPAVDNAPLPINVSANNQFKQGGVGISSLLIGPGSTLPGATNASIFGSVRIGSGTVTNGAGFLQVNDRIAVGSNPAGAAISPASVGQYGIIAGGIVTGLKGFWTPSNSYVGMAALTTPPTSTLSAPGNAGSVIADRFCFSGTNGACTTTWGGSGSGAFPAGTTGQTLFYQANGTTVTPTSTLMINGWTATLSGNTIATGSSDSWERVKVDNGALQIYRSGTDALFLNNTASGATMASIISNVPSLNFYSTDGTGHNSDIYVRDLRSKNVYASDLANSTTSNVCADGSGKLVLCSGGGSTGGNPTTSMQIYRYQSTSGPLGTSNPNTFTVPAGVTQILVEVIGAGGGGTQGNFGGGGGGSSRAYINVSQGTAFSVAVGQGGTTGPCSTNTNGGSSTFSGAGYSMVATGGNKATCTAGGTGGQGLSGTGSFNTTGTNGNSSSGGVPRSCSSGPCSTYLVGVEGVGGITNPGVNGVIVVSWATPNTSGTPVLALGGGSQTVSFQTAGSHSWTVPAGTTSVSIQVIGAGGGGGGGTSSQGGHGGGGGGYINAQNIPFTAGQTFTMSVGTRGNGGAVNSPGSDGGDTIFNGTTYRATGGKGATTSSGGVGGTATGPLGSAISGTNGAVGSTSGLLNGGSGGVSGGGSSFTSGQGGDGNQGGTAGFGGNGTNGAVVITYN